MVATGIGPTGFTDRVQVIDLYNSKTTCSDLSSYPFELAYATGGLINGSPLICGGIPRESVRFETLSSCYLYDRQNSTWQPFAEMSSPRNLAGSSAFGDSLWVNGGYYLNPLNSTDLISQNRSVTKGMLITKIVVP